MLSFRNLMWVRRRFCSVIKTALAVIVALACLAPSELSAKVKWSKKRPTIRSLSVRKSVPATPFSTVVIDAGHGGFDLPAYVVIESVFRHLAACFAHHWCVENSDLCSQLVIQLVCFEQGDANCTILAAHNCGVSVGIKGGNDGRLRIVGRRNTCSHYFRFLIAPPIII